MTPEQQRIAIAEACGWTHTKTVHNPDPTAYGRHPIHTSDVTWDLPLPDYFNDLNAMHEVEKGLKSGFGESNQIGRYIQELNRIGDREKINPVFASAAQRAEAFLCALGKWVD